jgi:hypothetical protein
MTGKQLQLKTAQWTRRQFKLNHEFYYSPATRETKFEDYELYVHLSYVRYGRSITFILLPSVDKWLQLNSKIRPDEIPSEKQDNNLCAIITIFSLRHVILFV